MECGKTDIVSAMWRSLVVGAALGAERPMWSTVSGRMAVAVGAERRAKGWGVKFSEQRQKTSPPAFLYAKLRFWETG